MYLLDIFKENGVDCSWNAIFVGRKLEFLLPQEVGRYAVEYLIDNPECCDSEITELAYGVTDSDVNTYLQKAMNSIGHSIIEKDGLIWNLEKRKWRYCILKNLEKSFKDLRTFFDSFQMIYADFGYPADMSDFLYNVPKHKDEDIQLGEEYHEIRIRKKIKTFLDEEKLKIEEKSGDWPSSVIYYPLDENDI